MAEKKKTAKTAPKSRVDARKKVNEGKVLAEEKSEPRAKKAAVAENATTTRKSTTKKSAGTKAGAGSVTEKASRKSAVSKSGETSAEKSGGMAYGNAGANPGGIDSANGSAGDVNAAKEIIYSLQAGTPIFVKTADICSAFGKTNQWIGQLTAQGTIHKTKTKYGSLYNLFDTVCDYCSYLEERAKKINEDEAEVEHRRKLAEAKLKESKAFVADLEAKEFQGKMHRSEDVAAMTADLLFFIRGSLLALAGRCAADCAACSDPAQVQKIIEREVFSILEELSEYSYDPQKYDERVRRRAKREVSDDESEEE